MFYPVEITRFDEPSVVIFNVDHIVRIERTGGHNNGPHMVVAVGDGYGLWNLTEKGLEDLLWAVGVDYPYRWETKDLTDGVGAEDAG